MSTPVSCLRCLPVRSLALLFLTHRATVTSVKAGRLAGGAPLGCPVGVPVPWATLHLPQWPCGGQGHPVLLHGGGLEKDVCIQAACCPEPLQRQTVWSVPGVIRAYRVQGCLPGLRRLLHLGHGTHARCRGAERWLWSPWSQSHEALSFTQYKWSHVERLFFWAKSC